MGVSAEGEPGEVEGVGEGGEPEGRTGASSAPSEAVPQSMIVTQPLPPPSVTQPYGAPKPEAATTVPLPPPTRPVSPEEVSALEAALEAGGDGVSVALAMAEQLDLFSAATPKGSSKLDRTLDAIREKFGSQALTRAGNLDDKSSHD